MRLHPATEKIIRQVEEQSGLPVLVEPDPALKLMATAVIARGPAPAHLVRFNPSLGKAVDYSVAYQCGLILRIFLTPPAERFDLVGTYRGRKDTEKLLAEHLRAARGPALPRESRDGLRDRLYDGLMLQLRSYPIGLRVDAWINRQFPDLAQQQQQGASKQLNENLQTLSPQVRQFAPNRIFEASVIMNAAFAIFWAKTWGEPVHSTPYLATGHLAKGQVLLDEMDAVADDPANDRRLTESWGNRLGLSGWYELQPFRT